jgi:hypothetical protein
VDDGETLGDVSSKFQNQEAHAHAHTHVVAAFSIFCVAEMSRPAAVMQSSELLLVNVDPLD